MIPPLDDNELDNSYLIAEGLVLAVYLNSINDNGNWREFKYQSIVKVLNSQKGPVKKNKIIIVNWTKYSFIGNEKIEGGPSDISLITGSTYKLFLLFNNITGHYYADRWNCAQPLNSSIGNIPEKIGNFTHI